MTFYAIWIKQGYNAFWYSDLSYGLLADGSPMPNIFTSIEDAEKFAKSVNLHDCMIKEIDTSNLCDIVNYQSANRCRYCNCWKRINDYE